MVQIDHNILEQLCVDEADITHRKALLGFTVSEAALLRDCRSHIEDKVDHIVERLQGIIVDFKEITPLLGDETRIENLCRVQRQYILDLFNGLYGTAYANNRLRVGLVHQAIGLELKFYLSTMSQLKRILCEIIETCYVEDHPKRNATRHALDKLLYFDTTLVLDTFILGLIKQIESVKDRIALRSKGFQDEALHFRDLSQRDSLTRLYNHGAFQVFLERDLLQAQRRHEPLALIYFDVDDFKRINDEEGHAAGDAVLIAISEILTAVCRKVDVLCRYGGDEFSVILPSCDLMGAERVCHRIIENFQTRYPDISLSFGISQTDSNGCELRESLCLRTDKNMYKAKKNPGFQIFK